MAHCHDIGQPWPTVNQRTQGCDVGSWATTSSGSCHTRYAAVTGGGGFRPKNCIVKKKSFTPDPYPKNINNATRWYGFGRHLAPDAWANAGPCVSHSFSFKYVMGSLWLKKVVAVNEYTTVGDDNDGREGTCLAFEQQNVPDIWA